MYLRICLQYNKVDVSYQTGQDKCYEDKSSLWGLRLVPLAATVQAEVGHCCQQKDTNLFKLKVTIWVDQLIFLIVEKDEGNDGPKHLEISLKFYQ